MAKVRSLGYDMSLRTQGKYGYMVRNLQDAVAMLVMSEIRTNPAVHAAVRMFGNIVVEVAIRDLVVLVFAGEVQPS